MRIATWNVNSVRARIDTVLDWLADSRCDVLAMQEIKCRDTQFPFDAFRELGYEVEMFGRDQWNGVALASRIPAEDVQRGFGAEPIFRRPAHGRAAAIQPHGTGGARSMASKHHRDAAVEARAIGATYNGVRLWSLYVPNGCALDDPHYRYKLDWLRSLAETASGWLRDDPSAPIALMGDWNIAPLDRDVWSMEYFTGRTHVSTPEREAFRRFEQIGYTDVVRPRVPDGYTYWDYKQLRWVRDEGMRIDFVMGSPAFSAQVLDARIDRQARAMPHPSDHVPVIVDIDSPGAEDEDDRPMVF